MSNIFFDKMVNSNDWFLNWFGSKYYHILYKNRSQNEANNFIRQLVQTLELNPNENVLDLGCGKGRHSNTLSNLFKNLDGVDISPENIAFARKNKASNQQFYIADMRKFKMKKQYGYIFNLFTSFGYFKNEQDNIKVLENCNNHLKSKGMLIIDFLNAQKVISSINNKLEIKSINNVLFELNKTIIDNCVIKNIKITDGKKTFKFKEKVKLFDLDQFKKMFDKTGFDLVSSYGDYDMRTYSKDSNRLILAVKKNKK